MATVRPTLLVTGFAPFGGDEENPSRLVARALEGGQIEGARVVACELPVAAHELRAALQPFWAARPTAILHLGLAGRRAQLALERIAINLLDYAIPDNAGERLHDMPIVAGGPAAYWSTLDVSASVATLRHHGLPAYASLSAGSFLCNAALYLSLDHLAGTGQPWVPCGFLHLPYLPSQAASKRSDTPSLALEAMVEAARIVLEAAVILSRARRPQSAFAPAAKAPIGTDPIGARTPFEGD